DCFGFPASLPSTLHHAGVKGFSTQKLSAAWQPAPHVGGPDSPEKTPEGIPFNVGIWEGTDGSTIIAALNPLTYGSQVLYDLSKTPPPPPPPDPNLTAQQNSFRARPREDWVKRIQTNGDLTGVKADYHYVGTGDIGGAPNESSVKLMEGIVTKSKAAIPGPPPTPREWESDEEPGPPSAPVQVGDGPVRVVWSKADQMFNDIAKCCKTDRMPRYKGDLELINHSAGSITSEAYQKRWIRKNELLADAAEKASVAAAWLGGRTYPLERLNNAWTLVMGGQFHDILPGTATPKSFEFAWNDDVVAMNQFAGVLTSATQAVASAMDTQTQGSAIVVYNPLNVERQDVVEAAVHFQNGTPKGVRVTGPDGKEVPAQVAGEKNGATKVIFLAKTPSVGYAVFDVRSSDSASSGSELKASDSSLENARYTIKLDGNGDVSSVFDKKVNRELLSAPIRLAISTDNPEHWPAWNMDFEDEQRAPRAYASGSPKVSVVENGPARVALRVERDTEGSRFVEIVRLPAGDAGNRIEFANTIDWNTKEANLKATFPLSAGNKMATYNWDIGTIQRPNEDPRQFEVASHQWIDLTDQSGGFGATVLTDCKNASDKPNDNTLRLTLIRTPGTRGGYHDQGTQDLGRHEILFGLAGHDSDWRAAQTDWQAYRLNQPLIAFESTKHPGSLGKQFSVLKLNNSRVRVLALKKAEQSDELVVRVVEMDGKPASNVHLSFASPVTAAREVNGQEQPVGSASVQNGELVTSFTANQPRSFAVRVGAAPKKVAGPQFAAVALPYDTSVASHQSRPAEGCFDCLFDRPNSTPQGKALPAEMLPGKIDYAGITFTLAPAGTGKANAITTDGQTINLPAGNFNRLYLLTAAAHGDHKGVFKVGDKPNELTIEEWTGFVGQWDDRVWKATEVPLQPRPGTIGAPPGSRPRMGIDEYGEMVRIEPGYIKRADIGWFASHRHDSGAGDEAYRYSYLFVYPIDVPAGAKTLTLPRNPNIRILAATVVNESAQAWPAQPLYDTLERDNEPATVASER
ncbi:MAG TPA: glycoside hydrolase family 38 C-terminal domain-containing protein, partial [Terriglobales bacterium]|nr:glycoside hydrolase family 38 C-terminal domain-containing protein [Terriglobales bacterium]